MTPFCFHHEMLSTKANLLLLSFCLIRPFYELNIRANGGVWPCSERSKAIGQHHEVYRLLRQAVSPDVKAMPF